MAHKAEPAFDDDESQVKRSRKREHDAQLVVGAVMLMAMMVIGMSLMTMIMMVMKPVIVTA